MRPRWGPVNAQSSDARERKDRGQQTQFRARATGRRRFSDVLYLRLVRVI
jgi:hypothetical protein